METVDILGIDLGTTNSAIAIWNTKQSKATILMNQTEHRLTPSVVAFGADEKPLLVGLSALEHMEQHPKEVVYSVKRLMGASSSNSLIRHYRDTATYIIQETPEHNIVILIGESTFTPQQISAEVLRKLKNDVEARTSQVITKVVITVPAYFNETQRQVTKIAGELAGLDVRRIINEPTAAALAFGLGSQPQTIAVYDMGGGTFDMSILSIGHGLFHVKATGGDISLGGDDIDQAIVTWLCDDFKQQYGYDMHLDENMYVRSRLRKEAERAKIALSLMTETAIYIPQVLFNDGKTFDIHTTLRRTTLEMLMQPFIQRSFDVCDEVLKEARRKSGIRSDDIDQVLLVGGQTRAPAIRDAIVQRYGWKLNHSVDPDEAVAQGAAILGARLCGHLKEQVSLVDVIPQSLGIQLANGDMEYILRANQQIPITFWRKGEKAFTTDRDGQERIRIRIFQGEHPIAAYNFFIGEVELTLTTVRPKGEAHINCMFKVDHDGILHVRAEDADTESEPVEATFTHRTDVIPAVDSQLAPELGEHR